MVDSILDMRADAMATYRGTADGADKAKALTGVVLVHAALAALILSGLTVHSVSRAVAELKTFDINVPPPPPPPVQPTVARAPGTQGAPGKKAQPTPVVAPKPMIALPVKPPIVAASIAGQGSAARSGAVLAGRGSGAGGSGSGSGGGGVAARWLSGGIYDSDNRGGRFAGIVGVRFTVREDGRIDGCRVARPSGDEALDSLTCDLLEQRLRFSPARDSAGRAVESEMGSTFTWGVGRRPY